MPLRAADMAVADMAVAITEGATAVAITGATGAGRTVGTATAAILMAMALAEEALAEEASGFAVAALADHPTFTAAAVAHFPFGSTLVDADAFDIKAGRGNLLLVLSAKGPEDSKMGRSTLGVVIISAILISAQLAMAQTAAQRRACTPDVFRLCKRFIPWRGRITKCLIKQEASLSPGCQAVILAR